MKVALRSLLIFLLLILITPISPNAQPRSLRWASTGWSSSPTLPASNDYQLESDGSKSSSASYLESEAGSNRSPRAPNLEPDADDTSTLASHVESDASDTALVPTATLPSPRQAAAAIVTSRVTICRAPSWRDRFYFLDYVKFAVFLIYSAFNWVLAVRYVSANKWQTYCNLTSYMLSYSSLFTDLFINEDYSAWGLTKLITNGVVFLIGGTLDSAIYSCFGHPLVIVACSVVEYVAVNVMGNHYNGVKGNSIEIINAAMKFGSVLVLIVGFGLNKSWNYVSFEFYSAILGMLYNALYIFEACTVASLVFITCGTCSQLLYTVLLGWHLKKKGIKLLTLSSGIDQANHDHRAYVSLAALVNKICCGKMDLPPSPVPTPTPSPPPPPSPPSPPSPQLDGPLHLPEGQGDPQQLPAVGALLPQPLAGNLESGKGEQQTQLADRVVPRQSPAAQREVVQGEQKPLQEGGVVLPQPTAAQLDAVQGEQKPLPAGGVVLPQPLDGKLEVGKGKQQPQPADGVVPQQPPAAQLEAVQGEQKSLPAGGVVLLQSITGQLEAGEGKQQPPPAGQMEAVQGEQKSLPAGGVVLLQSITGQLEAGEGKQQPPPAGQMEAVQGEQLLQLEAAQGVPQPPLEMEMVPQEGAPKGGTAGNSP